jgi:tRNA/tmRNA/rRNA uracil-C5-methylase (TrmA/RlmC/RlmD family)
VATPSADDAAGCADGRAEGRASDDAEGRAAAPSTGDTVELTTGPIATGGGCVARSGDGRVVFVRHSLPGERVLALVTATTTSFLRADAVTILEESPDRVPPPCPHAGPAGCGGCDWQHVAVPAQRRLKEVLIAEHLRRLAGVDRHVPVEEVAGRPDGLGWRTRMQFAVDRAGRVGLHRHRSHDIEPIEHCPIATHELDAVGVGTTLWKGARHVEVTASPDGGRPVIAVDTGRSRLAARPPDRAGLVVDGRVRRRPTKVHFDVLGNRFEVGPGVFWQVHPSAAAVLTRCVLEGLAPTTGERVLDLYAGAGLFSVPLAQAVGPGGSVVAVERSARACADAGRNARGHPQVRIVRSEVTPTVVAAEDPSDLVVLDPSREGAGPAVMRTLVAAPATPRRIAYVSCDPASFARDLRVALDAGWVLNSLRAFDLFPMTEHVELVGLLEPGPRDRETGSGARSPA